MADINFWDSHLNGKEIKKYQVQAKTEHNFLIIIFLRFFFSDTTMENFTSCLDEDIHGNLFDWKLYDALWNKTLELEFEDFCYKQASGPKIIPEPVTQIEGEKICRSMKGDIYTYQVSINQTKVDTNIDQPPFNKGQFWCGYTDEITENVFLSPNHNNFETVQLDLLWKWGQPNGGIIENCTVLGDRFTNLVSDVSCTAFAYVTCQFQERPKFLFRGDLTSLDLDPSDEYFILEMTEDMLPTDYHLRSFYGATIAGGTGEGGRFWTLTKDSKTLAIQTTSKFFPIGTMIWTNNITNKEMILNLNACAGNEFSCHDGSCISKWKRCDETYDCSDESDELLCDYVVFPSTYNSLIPPRNASNRTPLALNIVIHQVLDVGKLSETMELKFAFDVCWQDIRLEFQNLMTENINVLEAEAWTRMWVPNILFMNTRNSLTSKGLPPEEDSFVSVHLDTPIHVPENLSSVMKNFVYKGTDVTICKDNTYTVAFNCDFEWQYYPFDSQICSMIMLISTAKPELVNVNVSSVLLESSYANYVITQGNATVTDENFHNMTIVIPLLFVRDIKSIILNTYLPTFILTLINQLTNYYIGYEMFEAIITINATTLLTLTSLFISVFDSLPQTTNIKMIDIWMLVTFVYPFLIIIIHTLVHVNSSNRSKKNKAYEKALQGLGKFGLPFIFGVFTVVYVAFGAHQLTHINFE